MAENPAYPVGLRLTGRKVVVLGGGQVAQRRVDATLATVGEVVVAEDVKPPAVIVVGEVVAVGPRLSEPSE